MELDSLVLHCGLKNSLISDFIHHKKVTLKEVQSLNGLLNFACSVIRPGRAFLRRLIDLTVGVCLPNHCIIYLFIYLLNLYTVKKFIRYNSKKKKSSQILKSKILIHAVYLKILIEKAFKLIYGTRFPNVTM